MARQAVSLLVFLVVAAPLGSALGQPAPEPAKPRVIDNPTWIHRPSGDDLLGTYPGRAVRDGISGRVTLRCVATKDGKMSACSIVTEVPAGEGFGRAALKVSEKFQAAATDAQGVPIEGAAVDVPIQFKPPASF